MRKIVTAFCLSIIMYLFVITPGAWAMHISEGILPLKWAALWYVVAIPFLIMGIFEIKKKTKSIPSFKPLLGLMGALVFVISCMPVPVPTAGTCSHPAGTGISAVLIGPIMSIFVTSIALFIQALFLAHGGFTTWGADIVSMGVAGSFAGYIAFKVLRKLRLPLFVCGFAAGLMADWATYITTSFELSSALHGAKPLFPLFCTILIAFIPTQLPLGILEGVLTGGMIVFVHKRRPDILASLGVIKKTAGTLLLLALLLVTNGRFAHAEEQAKWSGIDETIVEKVAEEHGRSAWTPFVNTDQGDLLLFVFLLAGTAGGFVAGYNYQKLFANKEGSKC